jgi:hypothetical protein
MNILTDILSPAASPYAAIPHRSADLGIRRFLA